MTNLYSSIRSIRNSLSDDEIADVGSQLRDIIGLTTYMETDEFWGVHNYDEKQDLYSCHYNPATIDKMASNNSIPNNVKLAIFDIRGMIIHIPTKTIVSRGFRYIPTVTVEYGLTSNLIEGNTNIARLTDHHNNVHHIDFNSPTTTTNFLSEGCIMRISKFQNRVIPTTNRRIDITNSRWESSPTFLSLYEKFGGPDIQSLFSDKANSNITYLWLIVHTDLQMSSRYSIGEGYLMYLGFIHNDIKQTDPSFELEPNNIWQQALIDANRLVSMGIKDDIGYIVPIPQPTTSETLGKVIVLPSKLDFECVNLALISGASNLENQRFENMDPRLIPGEAVVCQFIDHMTKESKTIKICSVAVNWRHAVNNNRPNRYNQFVSYHSYTIENIKRPITPTFPENTPYAMVFNGNQDQKYTYSQLFPPIAVLNSEQFDMLNKTLSEQSYPLNEALIEWLIKLDKITLDTICTNKPRNGKRCMYSDSLLSNIAVNIIMATSYNCIMKATEFYLTFNKQLNLVSDFLCDNFKLFKGISDVPDYTFKPGLIDFQNNTSLCSEHKDPKKLSDVSSLFVNSKDFNAINKILTRIYSAAASHVLTRLSNGNITRNREIMSPTEIGAENLRHLIQKERDPTLYALLTIITKFMNQSDFNAILSGLNQWYEVTYGIEVSALPKRYVSAGSECKSSLFQASNSQIFKSKQFTPNTSKLQYRPKQSHTQAWKSTNLIKSQLPI